jgi:hypothetical protein
MNQVPCVFHLCLFFFFSGDDYDDDVSGADGPARAREKIEQMVLSEMKKVRNFYLMS